MTTAVEPSLRAPYKGLSPFDDSDADALLFFGRETETEIVAANALAARLTVLYGPSGVGKSSLLRAGVVHRLRRLSMTEPLAVAYYSSWAGDPATGIDEAVRGALAESFGGDPGDAPGDLADRIDGWTAALGAQLVLVLDQFEEHFLYHEESALLDLLPELVTRPGLRVNVVLGIRDDELARLDVFKAQIPGLFSNYLRLDRLTRDAARAAVIGPLERYNELADGHVEIEPQLVETLLGEVALGRIDAGLTGRAAAPDRTRIETPYLQLVLQRLWDVERERRSATLRLATLTELGGAQRIVEDHLERAMAALTPIQRDVAAGMFDHLVTPSGTKIAHGVADLASFAHVDVRDLQPVLSSLAHERILRPTGDDGQAGDRYEIYHDVLAGAVLEWKAQHEAEAALAEERAEAHRRQRRLAVVAGISLAAFALMATLTVYAYSQRSTARHQTALARLQRANAVTAEHKAQHETELAKRAEKSEQLAKKDALAQKSKYKQLSVTYARTAATERNLETKATAQADALAQRNGQLKAAQQTLEQRNADLRTQTQAALSATKRANEKTAEAKAAQTRTLAGELLQRAQAELVVDPVLSVRDTLASTQKAKLPADEQVLRSSLLATHVLRDLPGGAPVTAAVYSPDGSRIAVSTQAGELRTFSVADGKLLSTIHAGAPLSSVAWSPDGRTLIGGSTTGAVRVWDAASGTVLLAFRHGAPVVSVGFSPDGRLFETAGGHSTKLYDAASGVVLSTLPGTRTLRSAAFSSDSTLLLTTAAENTARVWSTATGDLVQALQQRSTINAAAFSPNGALVVTGAEDGTGRIWDTHTGAVVETLTGHSAAILAAAFSPTGDRVATGSLDGTVREWSTTNGLTDVVRGFSAPVVEVTFSPDGASGVGVQGDGRAVSFGNAQLQFGLLGQDGPARSVEYAPNGTMIATASGSTVRLWEPYGEPWLSGIHRGSAAATSVAFDPAGKLLASGYADGSVVVQPTHGAPVRTFAVESAITTLAWARNGLLLAASKNGFLHLRADDGRADTRTIPVGVALAAAALGADGETVAAAGTDRTIALWSTATGKQLLRVHAPADVTSLALDPTGRLLVAGTDPNLLVYDAGSGKLLATLTGHTDTVTGIAFSPDGSRFASSSRDHDARVWDAHTLKVAKVLHRHTAFISGVAFSRDGRWVATAGPLKAGVWSAGDAGLPGSFLFFARGNVAPINAVAWSPNGWELATASRDGSVRVLDCKLCGDLPALQSYARARLAAVAK